MQLHSGPNLRSLTPTPQICLLVFPPAGSQTNIANPEHEQSTTDCQRDKENRESTVSAVGAVCNPNAWASDGM